MLLPEPPSLGACLPLEGSDRLGLNSLLDLCYRSIIYAIFKAPALICNFGKISEKLIPLAAQCSPILQTGFEVPTPPVKKRKSGNNGKFLFCSAVTAEV